jgi:peptidyl-tRNA hydrolase
MRSYNDNIHQFFNNSPSARTLSRAWRWHNPSASTIVDRSDFHSHARLRIMATTQGSSQALADESQDEFYWRPGFPIQEIKCRFPGALYGRAGTGKSASIRHWINSFTDDDDVGSLVSEASHTLKSDVYQSIVGEEVTLARKSSDDVETSSPVLQEPMVGSDDARDYSQMLAEDKAITLSAEQLQSMVKGETVVMAKKYAPTTIPPPSPASARNGTGVAVPYSAEFNPDGSYVISYGIAEWERGHGFVPPPTPSVRAFVRNGTRGVVAYAYPEGDVCGIEWKRTDDDAQPSTGPSGVKDTQPYQRPVHVMQGHDASGRIHHAVFADATGIVEPPALEEDVKMVLCVRKDLGMSVGKMMAQVSHGAVAAVLQMNESASDKDRRVMHLWNTKSYKRKIALKVKDEDEFDAIVAKVKAVRLNLHADRA